MVLLSDDDERKVCKQAELLGMNANELMSLKALASRMSCTTISTAYSGIDSPGTSILQIIGAMENDYNLPVHPPKHLFAIEWNEAAQGELRIHPAHTDPSSCLFGDITDFPHPLLRSQRDEFQKTNKITSVLLPVVRDTPSKAIVTTLGHLLWWELCFCFLVHYSLLDVTRCHRIWSLVWLRFKVRSGLV